MIIRRDDGILINIETGAKHTIGSLRDGSTVVKLVIPSSGFERLLYFGDDDGCVAFLEQLAIELEAVRWNPDKRAFVSVSGGSDG